MNLKNKLVSTGVLLSTMAVSGVAFAGASGNIAVGSDQVWRGQSVTGHAAAVSGGLDYAHDSGVYLGGWTSNVVGSGNTEIDVYGGFSKDFGAVGIDVGAIYYIYPRDMDVATYEVYGGVSVSMLDAMVSYDVDSGNIHVNGGVSYEIMKTVSIGVSGGWDNGEGGSNNGDGYMYYGVSLTKSTDAGDFTTTVGGSTVDGVESNPSAMVSYSKGFDF